MKISIITPNYNYTQFIGKAIESVVNQDYDNIEHIIVDDGSIDNSVEIIKNYQQQYPGKIKLIQQENKGQTPALNIALSHVTGDVVCWLNSDDMFCENVFKIIIDYFFKYPNLFAVFGDIFIINKNDEVIRKNKYLKFSYLSAVFNGFGKEISSNAIFWRNTEKIYFDESFEYAMDSEYWSRLLIKKKVKKINTPIAKFRWHENAKTIKSKDQNNVGYQKVKEESFQIKKQAYSRHFISKIIPFSFSKPIYYFYRIRRLVLRGLKGQYFGKNKL